MLFRKLQRVVQYRISPLVPQSKYNLICANPTVTHLWPTPPPLKCSLFLPSGLSLVSLTKFPLPRGFLLDFRPELHHLASSLTGCSAISPAASVYPSHPSRLFSSLCLAKCSSSALSLASSCSMASICLAARSSSALSSASAKSFCCSCISFF